MSRSSSTENSTDDSTSSSEESEVAAAELGLRPYQFEPEIEISSGSESSDDEMEVEEEQHNRLLNDDWLVLSFDTLLKTKILYSTRCDLLNHYNT